MKIAIDGNIGCGKSTVINRLGESGYTIYPEDIASWGDWLSKYYKEPKRYSFGFQLTVLLSHLRQQSKEIKRDRISIFERCSHTCNRIFGSLLVEDGTMEYDELVLCEDYEHEFNNSVDVLIYLKTTPAICKKRIDFRDRTCESSIDIGYLEKLHHKYESIYNKNVVDGIQIYTVDSTKPIDFVYDNIIKIIKKL